MRRADHPATRPVSRLVPTGETIVYGTDLLCDFGQHTVVATSKLMLVSRRPSGRKRWSHHRSEGRGGGAFFLEAQP